LSEPEAKQHVLDSIERCRDALSAFDSKDISSLDDHKKSIGEILDLLESLKEKVFLKTKKALTPAYLVSESCQSVADLAEELTDGDDDEIEEIGDAVAQLKENAAKLQSASKQHSVIVT
jgi:hypothetical protein